MSYTHYYLFEFPRFCVQLTLVPIAKSMYAGTASSTLNFPQFLQPQDPGKHVRQSIPDRTVACGVERILDVYRDNAVVPMDAASKSRAPDSTPDLIVLWCAVVCCAVLSCAVLSFTFYPYLSYVVYFNGQPLLLPALLDGSSARDTRCCQ